MLVPLSQLACARSGDKGGDANIGVIARSPQIYRFLQRRLTADAVGDFFRDLDPSAVTRYELSNLAALNFVLKGILDGGGSVSLRIDAQGKALAQALLRMQLEIEPEILHE